MVRKDLKLSGLHKLKDLKYQKTITRKNKAK